MTRTTLNDLTGRFTTGVTLGDLADEPESRYSETEALAERLQHVSQDLIDNNLQARAAGAALAWLAKGWSSEVLHCPDIRAHAATDIDVVIEDLAEARTYFGAPTFEVIGVLTTSLEPFRTEVEAANAAQAFIQTCGEVKGYAGEERDGYLDDHIDDDPGKLAERVGMRPASITLKGSSEELLSNVDGFE
jgi:hypothetical protein